MRGTQVDKWPFVAALRQPLKSVFHYSRHECGPGEADLSGGISLACNFKSKLLETAYSDLEKFMGEAGIRSGGKYRIIFEKTHTSRFEEFFIRTNKNTCRVQSADTEGMRRAIFFLEDMLLAADGPFLPLGRINRKPWLKNRISRCYFGPIKRPPFNRDELMDDVDYYPDEYLNRLAHEGINGLWLTVEWRDLCKTSITKLPPDAPRRLAKLSRTVAKCARYGIKIWIFHIEPVAWKKDDPLLQKYPELGGADLGGEKAFCPVRALAQKYIRESVNYIFSEVPGLGGIINITHGERSTTCLSSIASFQDGKVGCQRCDQMPKWRIIHNTLSAMREGMKAASPSAELIAWFYMPNTESPARWVRELAAHMPDNVIFQYNFESNIKIKQLGKIRTGGDYWLSGVGPSDNFRLLAENASSAGTEVSAKMQVCCSHEVATVPYVPVPGILYRKYRKLRELGGKHVMQCWYFGNYPGLMHRAAGMLAFENFNLTEKQFLLSLARPEWGRAAEKAAGAWRLFSDAYENYPLCNMVQYYGPVHCGSVWPLYLKQINLPLAPTWMPDFPPSGDAIGECLSGNYTLTEALDMTGRICEKWRKGMTVLNGLAAPFTGNPERLADIRLAEALGLQFECARNIMDFYLTRHNIYAQEGKSEKSLSRLEMILSSELANRARLLELCRLDSRLGFHPEAEAYQYDRKRLEKSLKQIKALLKSGIPELRAAIAAGKINQYAADRRPVMKSSGKWIEQKTFKWRALLDKHALRFEIEARIITDYNARHFHLRVMDRYSIQPVRFFYFSQEGDCHDFSSTGAMKWNITRKLNVVNGVLTVPVRVIPWIMTEKAAACGLKRLLMREGKETEYDSFPAGKDQTRERLGMGRFNPDKLGIIEFA